MPCTRLSLSRQSARALLQAWCFRDLPSRRLHFQSDRQRAMQEARHRMQLKMKQSKVHLGVPGTRRHNKSARGWCGARNTTPL
jgi:hypothetical protein